MSEWNLFGGGVEPEWGKHIYLLVEHELWYDGPLLAAYVEAGVRLEDGRYCKVGANREDSEIITDVTMVAWRYVPDNLTHPRFDQELAATLAKFAAPTDSVSPGCQS